MSTQTTFKTVYRPITKVVSTILPSEALDFSGRSTTLRFTANQPSPFTSVNNAEHFFDGMPVIIHNNGTADIIIASGLMHTGGDYDIEPQTTAVFTWLSSIGKFFDNGGSSYAKDIQENLDTTNSLATSRNSAYVIHEHNGTDVPKVKVSNLDPVSGSEDWVLTRNSAGVPVFKDMRTYQQKTARYSNTNTTTNITPSSSWTEIPLRSTEERRDVTSIFTPVGNGIEVNWTGRVKVKTHVVASASIQNSQLDIAIKKNGAIQPRIASSFARVVSGANEATCTIIDEFDCLPGDTFYTVARQGGANGPMVMLSANSCYLEVEIPSGSFAKGDKGDMGYAGWAYIAQDGVPSSLLGNDGDVYLNTLNGDFYQRAAGSWSLRSNLQGPKGEQGISKSVIWAEKLGALTNSSEEWSFGAGSSSGAGRGLIQMVSGKITHLALDLRTAGTTSVSVEILLNGTATGQAITLSPSVNKDLIALGTPISFGPSDIIGFRTVLSGSAANARISALVVHDGVVIAPTGYVIPTEWKHTVTLNGTDITNQYIDLPHQALAYSIVASADRLMIHENEDFTITTSGGVSRINFINSLATGGTEALEAGQILYFKYRY